ncbi:hypothetical protein [Streptomyces sp. HSG2]|uniref:hypothetical protein n=1 Tax=Streptomyces sp. HSG2 TaxID=2797167 RepID=UPI00190518A7|nr:hypothetical protein [Streptomyces sp. HSG2]
MNRFQFVCDHQRRYGVKRLCQVLGIARSSFYYWRRTAPDRAARRAADAQLAARIQTVHRPGFDVIRQSGEANLGPDLGGHACVRLEGVSLGGGVLAGQRGVG